METREEITIATTKFIQDLLHKQKILLNMIISAKNESKSIYYHIRSSQK